MALGFEIPLLIVLIALSGFFSGAEVALVSLSKARVTAMINARRPGAIYVQKLKDNPHRMLSVILIGNNVVNIGAAAITTEIFLRLSNNYAVAIATGVVTLVILVFGEITPKSIAQGNNEIVALLASPFLWYLSLVLNPLIYLLESFLSWLFKLFGIRTKERAMTEEELISLIHQAEREGSIDAAEKGMIDRIFRFSDTPVKNVMTPRADVVMIDAGEHVSSALGIMAKRKLSRLPVYQRFRDNVVGIVYLKDLLRYINNPTVQVRILMRKAYFVPDQKNIASLLRAFQKRKENMALIVDEHGTVSGVATLEDVLEELVGEIMDETDEHSIALEQVGEKTWLADGRVGRDELQKTLGLRMKGKGYETLSGFILDHIGRIPSQGEIIAYGHFKMRIEEVKGHRVAKVRIEQT